MENQHRLIKGYRDLSAGEIASMNGLKQMGLELEEQLRGAEQAGADPRALSIARTHLQTGMMWAIRAVAKPEGF